MTEIARTRISRKIPALRNPGLRPRAERGSISAEQIMLGARSLAEEVGLDALSMPKLAEHLGIGVTSIYWYFRNKNDLLEALTIAAAQRFHFLIESPEDLPWDDYLFEEFTRLRAAMRKDPVSCDLLFMRGGRASDNALIHFWPGMEKSIGRMVAAGISPHTALQNITILSLYTRGSIVLERQMRKAGISPDVETPVPPTFPLLFRALEGQNTRGVSDAAHAAQLRAIIDGMALRARDIERFTV